MEYVELNINEDCSLTCHKGFTILKTPTELEIKPVTNKVRSYFEDQHNRWLLHQFVSQITVTNEKIVLKPSTVTCNDMIPFLRTVINVFF